MSVGVVVGRFQVDEPHTGHMTMIGGVESRNDRVLICLGVAAVPNTRTNPLDYGSREVMMRNAFPKALVVPLRDMPDDYKWSEQLDTIIEALFPLEVAKNEVTIYGAKTSGVLGHYHGRFKTEILDFVESENGTKV
ncbi:MAG TPA: hypothetical protein VEF04_02845, partial [Blastocatellia bacterium]|nr:hypothetical protein [Blastocatellia bacterium]